MLHNYLLLIYLITSTSIYLLRGAVRGRRGRRAQVRRRRVHGRRERQSLSRSRRQLLRRHGGQAKAQLRDDGKHEVAVRRGELARQKANAAR